MSYFIQQAYTGKNDWWRFVLTLMLVFTGWQIIGMFPLMFVAFSKVENIEELIEASADAFMSLGIDSNLYLFVMLISFFFGFIFLMISIKFIHKRKITSLITSRRKIDWTRVIYAFILWFGLSLILLFIDYSMNPQDYVWNFKILPFSILVIISLLFIPFQTSFEELLFRGYLMQGIGIWFKNATVPLIVTSVGFGLLHGFNPEVEKLGSIIMVYYIGTGFLFGIITLMDEGTELSLGLHAANNIVAATIVTMDWTVFQTEALLIDTSEPSAGFDILIPVLVVYPIVLLIFSNKYGWSDWKHKLFGSIGRPDQIESESINQEAK